MRVPFWEDSYEDDSLSTFGMKPNASLDEFRHLIDRKWSILDVGCGDGKNSLYLASLGYENIDAFDLSDKAIAKLDRIASSKGVRINSWVQDLTRFEFSKQYDLILSFGTLHFVPRESWRSFILEAKKNTTTNGMHIIQLFTNVLPASSDIAPYAIGFAEDEEIKRLYCDWNILQFRSYAFEEEHPGVPRHFHSSNKIVARKP